MGRVKFARMDITINRNIPSQYQVTGTPTLIFFKNGRTVNRITGLVPGHDIEKHIAYLLGG